MAVELEIIAEGSVENVMSGKKYNHAVHFHKLMYEALLRLAWRGFYSWLEEKDAANLPQLHETIKLIEELNTDVSQETFCNILQHPSCQCILLQFELYLDHKRSSNGSLSNFWTLTWTWWIFFWD
ncbi:hypothetical protein HOLleu_13974 [Holothuria leucospilota]|uniref:Uncharacterized protein n=1 Tax=Holothuria leucospilota TaxID=206669 RepID=A0A9Q1C880_HOLLE|nr:hypothetical protein HOLleu_13974 [Holothuria leucospilota]